jgi:hypothetical protein
MNEWHSFSLVDDAEKSPYPNSLSKRASYLAGILHLQEPSCRWKVSIVTLVAISTHFHILE